MNRTRRWVTAGIVAAGAVLTGCSDDGGGSETPAPATIEDIPGSDQKQITLTEQAVTRLGIATETVSDAGEQGTIVPYAAVLYDPTGDTSVYTNPSPLVYVRQPITVDHIEGSDALVVEGPPAGAVVVTVGAAELLGFENGVGK